MFVISVPSSSIITSFSSNLISCASSKYFSVRSNVYFKVSLSVFVSTKFVITGFTKSTIAVVCSNKSLLFPDLSAKTSAGTTTFTVPLYCSKFPKTNFAVTFVLVTPSPVGV